MNHIFLLTCALFIRGLDTHAEFVATEVTSILRGRYFYGLNITFGMSLDERCDGAIEREGKEDGGKIYRRC